jgi:hypothetical protein
MSRKIKGMLLGGALLLCIVLTFVVLLRYIAGPASAPTISSPAQKTTPGATFNMTPQTVHGTYATFMYPTSLAPQAGQQLASGPELATYSYGYRDIESWDLAISINHLAEPILTDDSGYGLRAEDPSRYHETTMTLGHNTFVIMTDTSAGGFSKVAFLLHGTTDADISLYGDDQAGQATLMATFNMVLRSWNWNI